MPELMNFPIVSQRDNDPNAEFDCVPASIAMGLRYLTGGQYTARQIKDAVYGESYVGGTAASAYVSYCASQGVKLAPVDGSGMALVEAINNAIAAGHPVLITEPDPYLPPGSGFTHVCIAYKSENNQITVMDPWIAAPVTKADSAWSEQLQDNQIWTMQKGAEKMPIPQGWSDDGHTLRAKNTVPVVMGFREHILQAASWDGDNVPQEAEYHSDQVLLHNASVGAGQRQVFRDTMLWYTTAKGVVQEPYLGLEVDAAYKQITALEEQIAQLKAAPPAPAPAAPEDWKKQVSDAVDQALSTTLNKFA